MLPGGIQTVPAHLFDACSSLESIVLPESVSAIGEYAFRDCRSLTAISIPAGVTEIGENAFQNAVSLQSIALPEGVLSVEDGTFSNCMRLERVTLGGGITKIGDSAFADCTSLTQIALSDTLRELGTRAFCGCTALAELHIPAAIREIGPAALHETAFYDALSDKFTVIGDGILIKYNGDESLVTVPDGIKQIADAFGARPVTGLILPDSVTGIRDEACKDCVLLQSVTFGNGLERIGDYALPAHRAAGFDDSGKWARAFFEWALERIYSAAG
ncbi:MAG: leucine-rich repeat protein [Acutalibacteraceae bacterium]